MELFDKYESKPANKTPDNAPLAERMRPKSLDDFYGQEHLIGVGKFLRGAVERGDIPSLILWGPPGCGKTTLANIVARSTGSDFVAFSAVLSGVKEIREVIKRAETNQKIGRKTILFVDEIHRFNKGQQDAFLHSVEDGTITLIGATTENPSFEVNAPLLSRCKVLVLKALEQTDITELIKKSLPHIKLPPDTVVEIDDETIEFIAGFSHGDAREALNTLENAALIATPDKDGKIIISIATAKEAMQKQALRYDKSGEEHYNIVSAFIKSMRGSDPDASLYWLSRMVEAGEDPLFIARRMVVFASEDVGNADPAALTVAMGVKEAVQFIGMPEGWIPLAQGTTYLATADKSNASYTAYKLAKGDVTEHGNLPVPLHLRNAPTKLMKKLGYGEGYKYPHNYKDARAQQQYMPDRLKDKKYYTAPSPAPANKTENKEKKKK